jgi:hypothetical protein
MASRACVSVNVTERETTIRGEEELAVFLPPSLHEVVASTASGPGDWLGALSGVLAGVHGFFLLQRAQPPSPYNKRIIFNRYKHYFSHFSINEYINYRGDT